MQHELCAEDDLAVGDKMAVEVDGNKLVLFRLEDGYYATQPNCTHLFFPLNKGKIVDGDKIRCAFHRAQFDIRTGEVVEWANFPPGVQLINTVRKAKALKTYPVTVADGKVLVEL